MTLESFLRHTIVGLSFFGIGIPGRSPEISAQDIVVPSIVVPSEWISPSPWIINETSQPIQIISERVISTSAPRAPTEVVPAVEESFEDLKSLEVGEPQSVREPACQCEMLMPGGEIWQRLLEQELENARLQAKLELAKIKFELFEDSLKVKVKNANDEVAEQLSMERKKMNERVVEMEANMRKKMEVLLGESKEKMLDQTQRYESKIGAMNRKFEEDIAGKEEKLKAVSIQIEKLEKELIKTGEDSEKAKAELRKANSDLEKAKRDRNRDA